MKFGLLRLFGKSARIRRGTGAGVSVKVSGRLKRLQLRVADALNRKTAYWNRGSKVVALLVLCFLFGGACLYLLLHGLLGIGSIHH
jgi:hypothetical protein